MAFGVAPTVRVWHGVSAGSTQAFSVYPVTGCPPVASPAFDHSTPAEALPPTACWTIVGGAGAVSIVVSTGPALRWSVVCTGVDGGTIVAVLWFVYGPVAWYPGFAALCPSVEFACAAIV